RDDVADDACAHARLLGQCSQKIAVNRLAEGLRSRLTPRLKQGGAPDEPVQLFRHAVHVDRKRGAAVANEGKPQLFRGGGLSRQWICAHQSPSPAINPQAASAPIMLV